MEPTPRGEWVILLADLEDFLHDHRPHGPQTADATVFERWVMPEDAELDLLHAASMF
jgi:hypothetical protein